LICRSICSTSSSTLLAVKCVLRIIMKFKSKQHHTLLAHQHLRLHAW
jgi:hypothetical protein